MVESLEREMELLCLTGVEDRLQDHVRPTLELLRNAGIKVRASSLESRPEATRSWLVMGFSARSDVSSRYPTPFPFVH